MGRVFFFSLESPAFKGKGRKVRWKISLSLSLVELFLSFSRENRIFYLATDLYRLDTHTQVKIKSKNTYDVDRVISTIQASMRVLLPVTPRTQKLRFVQHCSYRRRLWFLLVLLLLKWMFVSLRQNITFSSFHSPFSKLFYL